MWVSLQVMHVAGQVGEQRLHLPAPQGLQEEALVVAEGREGEVTVQAGQEPPPHRPSGLLSPPLSTQLNLAILSLLKRTSPPTHRQTPLPPPFPTPATSSREKEAGFALGGAEELQVGATGTQRGLVVLLGQPQGAPQSGEDGASQGAQLEALRGGRTAPKSVPWRLGVCSWPSRGRVRVKHTLSARPGGQAITPTATDGETEEES